MKALVPAPGLAAHGGLAGHAGVVPLTSGHDGVVPLTSGLMAHDLALPAVPGILDGADPLAAVPGVLDGADPAGPAGDAARAAGAPRSRAEVRRLFLDQSAVSIGQRWADQWRSDLHREGRPAAGGWPGTLREARVRVERHFLAEATRRKISAVTQAEREVAAKRAYASARARWCRQAEPEAP